MLNVLFDRESLRVVGLNRPALPFEVSIDDVICDDLTKVVEYPEVFTKPGVFLLPQDPLEDIKMETKTVETTEETDKPVMIQESKKVPLGISYEKTFFGKTTQVTDEPVMIQVDSDDGSTEVQEVDEDGKLLYWGLVSTGEWVDCYTTVEEDVQKTDADGQPLYYLEVEEPITVTVEQPPLEIHIDDERWTMDLQRATEVKMTTKTLRFVDQMEEFTYDEVSAHKEKIIADGSLFRSERYQKEKGINVYEKAFDLEKQLSEKNKKILELASENDQLVRRVDSSEGALLDLMDILMGGM